MNVLMIVTLILAIPVVLLPALLIWYINFNGLKELYHRIKVRKCQVERN